MSIDDDSDLNLSIPVKSFLDEFICPICFNSIKECFMTPCGHNFCKDCIHECINRKHVCPCCNHTTTKDQLVKNHMYDNLLVIITREKDEASKKYFENLISSNGFNSVKGNEPNAGTNASHAKQLSPIEELFHQHMKKGLSAYEDYYKELKNKFEKKQQSIKDDYLNRMQQMRNKTDESLRELKNKPKTSKKIKAESEQQITQLAEQCEAAVRASSVSLESSVDLLLKSYDQYLRETVPKPTFLPVTVSVSLVSHGLSLDNVTLRTTDSSKDLKDILEKRLKDLGNPVTSFPDKITVSIKRPSDQDGGNETVIVDNEEVPLLQYKLEPGCIIVIGGDVKLKSDQPQQCFTAIFVKGTGQSIDYYTCKDCKFNWICKPCAENCHKGHAIVEYVMNHKPTWNCCYCVKNKKCKLPNHKKK